MQMMMNTMLGVLWSGDTRYTPDTAAGQWRVITNSNLSLGLQLSTTPGTARAHSNLSNKLCVLAAGRSWQAPTSLWLHANWTWGVCWGAGGSSCMLATVATLAMVSSQSAQTLNFMFIVIANITALPRMPSRSLKSRAQYPAATTLSFQTEWRH